MKTTPNQSQARRFLILIGIMVLVALWGAGILVDGARGAVPPGLELESLDVEGEESVTVRFLLTDRAGVVMEIVDPGTGALAARRAEDFLSGGSGTITFTSEDFAMPLAPGSYLLRVRAEFSAGGDHTVHTAEAAFATAGGGFDYLTKPLLLGNMPNPFRTHTDIRFVVPDGPPRAATVRIFDLRGRMVRTLLHTETGPGVITASWDGRDAGGRPLSTGIYFYRVTVGTTSMVSRMMLIR